MKKYLIIALFLSLSYSLSAQFVADSVQVKAVATKNEHFFGIKYGYGLSGVMFNFDAKTKRVHNPLNFGVTYTYYHTMWGFMDYFGIQFGVNYTEEGFQADTDLVNNEKWELISGYMATQFKFDISWFKILVNIGGFGGYRLSTDKPGGFDCYDMRTDYGVLGGAGFGFKFHPFELHLEGWYKHSLSTIYYPEKINSSTWIYSHPNQIMISASLLYKLPF